MIVAKIKIVNSRWQNRNAGVSRATAHVVVALRQMDTEFAVDRAHGCGGHLTASLFSELNGLRSRAIDCSSDRGGQRDVLHQPYPLTDRLGPHFFVSPTDLVWPVGLVVKAFCLNPHRKRANCSA